MIGGRLTDFTAVMVLVASIACLLGLAAGWGYFRILRKISAITAVARRLAAGEQEASVHIHGPGPLKELGNSVNQLGQALSSSSRQLHGERGLLDGVLDAMQEGVLLVDAQGHIQLVNASLREMLLLNDDPRGRLPLEVIRHAPVQELLDRVRQSAKPDDAQIQIAGLKPRHLLVRALPLPNQPRAVLAVVVDVTELRQLEALRRDFVANVSHELRTPVAAICSAAETLSTGALDDPPAAKNFVEMIERQAARMQRLVNDLLDLAKIESRELNLQIGDLPLQASVAQAMKLIQSAADQKNMELVLDLAGPTRVRADARALEQVLTNLLDNAIKYCPAGARINVQAIPDVEKMTRIVVKDNGPGIEARHCARLFERFYRADPGRSRQMGGTGLGLSIVKHLVEAMGGEVGVESMPGQGAAFWFTLIDSTDHQANY